MKLNTLLKKIIPGILKFFIILLLSFNPLYSETRETLPDYSVSEKESKNNYKSKNAKINFVFPNNYGTGFVFSSPYGLSFRYFVLNNKSLDIALGLDPNLQNTYISILYHFHSFSLLHYLNFLGTHFAFYYGGGFRYIHTEKNYIAFTFSGGLSYYFWNNKMEFFSEVKPLVFPMIPEPTLTWEWSAGIRYYIK